MKKKKMVFIFAICFFFLAGGFLGGMIYSTQKSFESIRLLQESNFVLQLSRAEEAYTEDPSTAIWALRNVIRTLDDLRSNKVISEKEYYGQRYIIYSRVLHFETVDGRDTSRTMEEIREARNKLGDPNEKTKDDILEALYKRDTRFTPGR